MKPKEHKQKEVTDLCVMCGLCCDGTLFPSAKMTPKDSSAIELLGKIVASPEKDKFKLPCPHFCGKCTVYDKVKPSVCNDFYCTQIQKFNSDQVSFDEVKNKIEALKRKVKLLEREIKNSHPSLSILSNSELNAFLNEEEKQLGAKETRLKYSTIMLHMKSIVQLKSEFLLKK